MYRVALFLFILLLFTVSAVTAQQRQPVDWDFSYASILEKNKVGKDELIRQWLAGIKSPAEKWVKGWKGKPITSSILIEYPAFHAAERQTIFLVRTADEAHYWELTEDFRSTKWADEAAIEEPFSPQIYDSMFKAAWVWQQHAPRAAAELPEQAFPGYMGFISLYGPDGSRQMLLTLEDFFDCPSKECVRGQTKPGRVMSALQPVLISESKKNYKHKSESEIAAMTPEQRIDEQILENDSHMFDLKDQQSQLIEKYSRADGLKGSRRIVELIDDYHPKRKLSDRSHAAMMMASQIDERIVRLRASAEGRDVIKAVERLAARIKDPDGMGSLAQSTLRSMTGTNLADDSIRDTLWVRHRIKLTDEQFSAFVNYLIETDPTYPSWSERQLEMIKDSEAREVNDLGLPVTQVFVMKKPERFYQAYLNFKKKK